MNWAEFADSLERSAGTPLDQAVKDLLYSLVAAIRAGIVETEATSQ